MTPKGVVLVVSTCNGWSYDSYGHRTYDSFGHRSYDSFDVADYDMHLWSVRLS